MMASKAGRKLGQANMRGQYFSLDAIVAVLVFAIALSLLAAYWFPAKATMQEGEKGLLSEALSISNSLLTPGEEGWVDALESGDAEKIQGIRQIGFAAGFRTNEISPEKARKLRDLASYGQGKRLLSTSRDYRIEIDYGEGKIIIGAEPPANSQEIGVATRGITAHGNGPQMLAGTLKVMVWE